MNCSLVGSFLLGAGLREVVGSSNSLGDVGVLILGDGTGSAHVTRVVSEIMVIYYSLKRILC